MKRFRRLRVSEQMRRMVRETRLAPEDLIYPLFVIEGSNIKNPVDSMPNVYQWSVDRLEEILPEIAASGVSGILLFGIPANKDACGSQAYNENGVTQQAVRYLKAHYPELIVITDVCLCEYTSHGHCGLINDKGQILNDPTLPLLAQMSVSLCKAGADIIAPSDMMDGRIGFIRDALDDTGFENVPIMAYSAKFASGYYSPFRDAAHSAPSFGDRKTYQMDTANGREAMRELEDSIEEGADFIMVKPALAYLDVLKEASMTFDVPLVTYNVIEDFALVRAAPERGWLEERRIVTENLTAMKRAGAKIIITYHALDMAKWLKEEK